MNARRDAFLAIFALALLACGWALKSGIENQRRSFSAEGMSLSYPAAWSTRAVFSTSGAETSPRAEAPLFEAILQRPGDLLPLSLKVTRSPASGDLHAAFVSRGVAYASQLPGYRLLGSRYVTTARAKAIRFEYAFVDDSGKLPGLAYCADYLVPEGDSLWVFSGRGDAAAKASDLAAIEAAVDSARFSK